MKTHRTAIGAVALISFFALTGAKAEGCGGTVETEPEPSPCAAGEHLEDLCLLTRTASAEPGAPTPGDACTEDCQPTCVPDEVCPDGTMEQTFCDEPLSSSGSGAPDCLEGDCTEPPPPPPGYCWTECVPIGPCGPGFYEEWVCDPLPAPSSEDPTEPSPPPENCYLTCIPVDPCGPGFHEELVCEPQPVSGESDEPAPPPGECTVTCVPDLCPPGIPAVEVCMLDESGQMQCWTECGPEEPPDSAS